MADRDQSPWPVETSLHGQFHSLQRLVSMANRDQSLWAIQQLIETSLFGQLFFDKDQMTFLIYLVSRGNIWLIGIQSLMAIFPQWRVDDFFIVSSQQRQMMADRDQSLVALGSETTHYYLYIKQVLESSHYDLASLFSLLVHPTNVKSTNTSSLAACNEMTHLIVGLIFPKLM